MSKAPTAKKFVLVSLDTSEDSKNIVRKMRRYLNGNKLNHIFSSNVDEMKEFLDKIHSRRIPEDISEIPEDDVGYKSIVTVSSNQEILEKWARETFSADSSEIQLLFGTPDAPLNDNYDDDESNGENSPRDAEEEMEHDMISKEVPKIFSVHSVDSLPETHDSRKDEGEIQMCVKCSYDVEVGRNRNTKLKRQSMHVLDKHFVELFDGLNVCERYECLRCSRKIPVYKSPCDHITEYHIKEDVETEFSDLWSKDQLGEFNRILDQCFGRQLPVPRSRRLKNGWFIAPKASYRIKQGDEIVQIDTLAEKMRPGQETKQTNKKEDEIRKSQENDDIVILNDVRKDHDYYVDIDEYEEEMDEEDDFRPRSSDGHNDFDEDEDEDYDDRADYL